MKILICILREIKTSAVKKLIIIPVHLAHTGNTNPLILKHLSSFWWHINLQHFRRARRNKFSSMVDPSNENVACDLKYVARYILSDFSKNARGRCNVFAQRSAKIFVRSALWAENGVEIAGGDRSMFKNTLQEPQIFLRVFYLLAVEADDGLQGFDRLCVRSAAEIAQRDNVE